MSSNYIWCNSTRFTHFLNLRFSKDLTIKKKRIILEIQNILQIANIVSDYWQMKNMILMVSLNENQ